MIEAIPWLCIVCIVLSFFSALSEITEAIKGVRYGESVIANQICQDNYKLVKTIEKIFRDKNSETENENEKDKHIEELKKIILVLEGALLSLSQHPA